ncbi:MAG: Heimdall-CTERM domain-containing surface protein, partial [Candidatus Hodarchaeales archaeon]
AGAGDAYTADLPSDATSAAGIVYIYFYAEDSVGNGRFDADTLPYEVVVTAPVTTTETPTTTEETTEDTTTTDDGGTPSFEFLSVLVLLGIAVVVSRRRRR